MKILIKILFVVLLPSKVMATSCWTKLIDEEIGLSKLVDKSDLAFKGVVEISEVTYIREIAREEFISSFSTVFANVEKLDGSRHDKVILKSNGHCSCKYDFEVGVEYVILASKIKDENEYYIASCSRKYTLEEWELIRPAEDSTG